MNLEAVKRVKDLHEDELMALDCVQGVGIQRAGGEPVIAVYIDTADAKHRIPSRLDDVPVIVEESGIFEAH